MKMPIAFLIGVVVGTGSSAQDMTRLLAHQLEAPEGTPAGTATVFGGNEMSVLALIPSAVLLDSPCIRFHPRGGCVLVQVKSPNSPDGFTELTVVSLNGTPEDFAARYQELGLDGFYLSVGNWTPSTTTPEVSITTQSPFGGLMSSVQPIEVVSVIDSGFVIQGAPLGPLSVGAPVEHSDLGIIGVVSEAQEGIARVIDITVLTAALARSGFEVLPDLLPRSTIPGELPREILRETGTGWLFTDYAPSLGYTGIYYGPGANPSISSLDYSAEFELQIFALSEDATAASLLTSGRAVSSMKDGVSLNAPYDRSMPQMVATCVLHETPSSSGRRVFVINMYRATPGSLDTTVGTWSFDGVGANLSGFEDGPTTCLDRLNALTPDQRAALTGVTVSGEEARESSVAAGGQSDPVAGISAAREIAAWEGTGNSAVSIHAMDDLELFLSCTESMELVIAVQGGKGTERILLDGDAGKDAGVSDLYRYGYFGIPSAQPAVIQIVDENARELEAVEMTGLPTECNQ